MKIMSIKEACRNGDLESVKLLAKNVRPCDCDKENSVLALAASLGNLDMVKCIDEHIPEDYKIMIWYPVENALKGDHVDVYDYLSKRGYSCSESCIYLAILFGSLKMVKYFLSVYYTYSIPYLLKQAIGCDHPHIVLLLLEHGVKPTKQTKLYFYPYILKVIRKLKVTQRFHPYLILEILERRYSKVYTVDEMFRLIEMC